MAWYDDLLSPFQTYEEDDVGGSYATGDYDWGKIIGAGTGALTAGVQIADLLGYDVGGSQQQPAGYQGGIPNYTVSRQQVPGTYDPDRRPGSGGQRYFTDVRYDGGDTSEEAAGLAALNRANMASRDRAGQAMPEIYAARQAAAQGGIQQLAEGGFVRGATGIFQSLANPSDFTSGGGPTGVANSIANNTGGAFDYTAPPPAATTPPPAATTPPPAATTPPPNDLRYPTDPNAELYVSTPGPADITPPPAATTLPSLDSLLPSGPMPNPDQGFDYSNPFPFLPPRDPELPANLVDPNLPNTIVGPNGEFITPRPGGPRPPYAPVPISQDPFTPAVTNNPGIFFDADGNTVSYDDIIARYPDASRPNPILPPIKPIGSPVNSITIPEDPSIGVVELGPDNINPNAKPDTGLVDPGRNPMSNPDWMRMFGIGTTPDNFNQIVPDYKPQKLRYDPNITKMINGKLYAQGVDINGNPQPNNWLGVEHADKRRKAFDDEQRAQYQEYTNALGPNFTQGQLQRYKAQKFIEKQKDTYKDKGVDAGFFDSEEYQKYLSGPQWGTQNVVFSPYFGRQGSGSMSARQDAAYEEYLRRTGQTDKITKPKTEQELIDAGIIGVLPADDTGLSELKNFLPEKTLEALMGVGPTGGVTSGQMPPGFTPLQPGELGFTENMMVPIQGYAGGSATFDESAPYKFAQGGIVSLKKPIVAKFNQGGIIGFKEGRYLDGDTDGMADEKPAMIDGEEPALLSDGEFVIPADVVSHLGNGNSDAGAKVLEEMMARVRKARTGSEEQGAQIDPNDFIPV